ncbi:MAG TPA: phosphatase PAP2 family protein, partial [Blastocatellia bacterium]|nr:phosphatase PAP2 family protein [Blastocatellia bacterium]
PHAGPRAPPGETGKIMAVETQEERSDEAGRRLRLDRFMPLAALCAAAAVGAYLYGDLWITQFLQRFKDPYFHWLMVAVSWPGYQGRQWIVAVCVAALLLRYGLRIEAACLLISLGSSLVLANVIKLIVARTRPSPDLVDVYLLHSTMSFPSGHVLSYMVFFGFLFYLVHTLIGRSALRSALLVILGVLIGLVGLSRVYLGAHWASDALAAYSLGLLCLALMIRLHWRLKSRRISAGED